MEGATTAAAVELTTAARQMVRALVAAGVDTYFGIPGGPVSPVFDAVLATPGARLVESRHETQAAFAAAGYHRACGKVAAVVVTAGPGATNVVTGVTSAHCGRVPMLVICGDVAWAARGGKLLQDSGPQGIDVERMLSRVTRAAVRVAQPATAAAQALAALQAATQPARPGPALLVLAIQTGNAPAAALPVERGALRHEVRPSPTALARTCEVLEAARHPLVVVGAGGRPHAGAVRELIEALGVPVITTPQAKGIVPESHPLSLRHGGLAASLWARRYTALGVDGALVLGTDLDDCSVGPTPYVTPPGALVHVDLDANVFGRNLPTALGVEADVGAFAADLTSLVRSRGVRRGGDGSALPGVRAQSPFDQPGFREDTARPVAPARVLADLETAAGPDAAFVTDIGEHMLFALHYLTAESPDRFTIHLGLGSMGSGIGSAVGLALGRRPRRVVCVCGDGGMQMAGMEILVAIRERLPIVFAVFNDARYNMVYHGFKQVFGREAPWDTAPIDFVAWAGSMGVPAARIDGPGEITASLLGALGAAGGPCVLDIRIDRDVRLAGGGRNEALLHMSMLERK